MRKGKKLFSTFAMALALTMSVPSIPANAEELQDTNEYVIVEESAEATETDATGEKKLVSKCGDMEFFSYEGEPIKRDGAVTTAEEAVSVEVAARNLDQYRNKFVYQKLTSAEKRFYDGLEKLAKTYMNTNIDSSEYVIVDGEWWDLLDGVSYSGISTNRAQELIMIFEYQNPQYYFLANYWAWDNASNMYVGIYSDFWEGSERARCSERFFNNVDTIVNRVKQKSGDYNIAKAAHDEVCDQVVYEFNDYDQTAWSTFMLHETVCAGYSKAYTIIANACGIETLGDTSNVEGYEHAWNRAYVDGNWYYVDCTWDDDIKGYGTKGYDYFLISKSRLNNLDWTPAHNTESSYNGLLPNCPYNYDPSNPKVGEVPPTDGLSEVSVFVAKADRDGILAGVTTNLGNNSNLEFCWYATADQGNSWMLLKDWTLNDEWLAWTPDIYGEYDILVRVREKGKSNYLETYTGYSYHPYIKGKCQMPYTGAGGGYLIGVESYENPYQSFQYEMLILDCTLLAQGLPAWTYTTGKCPVAEGNALWTIWQPQYGYYWTLFRVFDGSDRLLDEACYGFVNAY